MNRRLELNFVKEDGGSARISVPNADEGLDALTVKDAMEAVVTADVFAPGGSAFVAAASARMVTTDTVDYDLEG